MNELLLNKKEISCYYEINEICRKINKGKSQVEADNVIHALYFNLVQTIESINLLVKEKKYLAAKSLFRKCIETTANINCILEYPETKNIVKKRAKLLNIFTMQHYMHRVSKLYSKMDDTEDKKEIETSVKYLSPLTGYKFETISDALTYFTNERDKYYKNKSKNKKLWFTACTDFKSKQDFIDRYGKISKKYTSFLYNMQSEDTHGTGILLSLGSKSLNGFSRQDWVLLVAINKLLEEPTTYLIVYSKAKNKCGTQIDYLLTQDEKNKKYWEK